MSAVDNARTIRRAFAEAVNQGNLAVLFEAWHPDIVNHSDGGGDVHDRADIERWINDTRAMYPDLHAHVETLVADDDHVATRETWSATHAVTGRRLQGTVLHIFRFERGKVVEEWSAGWDWLNG